MNSTFIRFVNKKSYLIDDLLHVFDLKKHNISFRPSFSQILPSIIQFWDENNIRNETIQILIKKYKELNEAQFWSWCGRELKSNNKFNINISYLFTQVESAEIKMKCFTELRDNQKLHPNHNYWFGHYGISLNNEWMFKHNADRIIYVDPKLELTNRIARVLTMLLSTNSGNDVIKSMFDVLAFTEIEANSHEYEWRIVGNHYFGGKSYGNYPDNIPFKTDDIEHIYVQKPQEIDTILNIIDQKNKKEGTSQIPTISTSESIFLTNEEMEEINKISTRK